MTLDTGSEISCLNSVILDRLPQSCYTVCNNLESTLDYVTAGAERLNVDCVISLNFVLGVQKFEHLFHLVRNLPCDILIGQDFLRNRYRTTIDQINNQLVIASHDPDGTPLIVPLKGENVQYARVARTMIIQPKQTTRLPLLLPDELEKNFKGSVVFEPLMLNPHLVLARTLSKSKSLQTTVLNISSKPMVLEEKTIIGTVERGQLEPKHNHFPPKSAFKVSELTTSPVVSPESKVPARIKFGEKLTKEQHQQLTDVIVKFADVFGGDPVPHSTTNHVEHSIHTGDATPIKQKPYSVSEKEKQVIRAEISKMLLLGIIRPSKSAWASPIVLVKKKDGTLRFCVDYRKLNTVTRKDVYPLPRIEDILNYLKGKKYFSLCDAIYGFWQVPIVESDIPKTAFISSEGLYEFIVMPFGFCNAPATFQRLMDEVLQGIRFLCVLDYIDDLLTYSDTWTDHLQHLQTLFGRLRQSNIKLKPSKCHFGMDEIAFLGFKVSANGIAPDPGKIRAVEFFPSPKNVTQVKSFTGLCNYYRRFVKGFARIAQPLNHLTKSSIPFHWG